jgi:hypothetical protein
MKKIRAGDVVVFKDSPNHGHSGQLGIVAWTHSFVNNSHQSLGIETIFFNNFVEIIPGIRPDEIEVIDHIDTQDLDSNDFEVIDHIDTPEEEQAKRAEQARRVKDMGVVDIPHILNLLGITSEKADERMEEHRRESALAWMRGQAKELDPSIADDESVSQCARVISFAISKAQRPPCGPDALPWPYNATSVSQLQPEMHTNVMWMHGQLINIVINPKDAKLTVKCHGCGTTLKEMTLEWEKIIGR